MEGYDAGMLSLKKGATLGYLEQMPIKIWIPVKQK